MRVVIKTIDGEQLDLQLLESQAEMPDEIETVTVLEDYLLIDDKYLAPLDYFHLDSPDEPDQATIV